MSRNGTFSNESRVAGRRVVARPPITMETWYVIVHVGEEICEAFLLTCEPNGFAEALLAYNPSYGFTTHPDSPTAFNYVRELVTGSTKEA